MVYFKTDIMKRTLITLCFLMLVSYLKAQDRTDTIKVKGNCEHCKERVEEAVSQLPGLKHAQMKPEQGILVVRYDASQLSNELIQKKVAAVGHDTQDFRADDKIYKALPACCKYDRDEISAQAGKIRTFRFRIEGMTCDQGCAKGIEMAMYKQKGVKTSTVDYGSSIAKVVFDSTKISQEELIRIVENFRPANGEKTVYKVVLIP